jgi:hypothetical protein
MGAVMAGGSYDAYSPPFENEVDFLNSSYAISDRPDRGLVYGFECKPGSQINNRYLIGNQSDYKSVVSPDGYIISTAPPESVTDLGTLIIAQKTEIKEGEVLGQLWVVYDVELFVPRMRPLTNISFRGVIVTPTAAAPFGVTRSNTTTQVTSELGGVHVTAMTNTFIYFVGIPQGEVVCFTVTYQQSGGGTTTCKAPELLLTGATFQLHDQLYDGANMAGISMPSTAISPYASAVTPSCTSSIYIMNTGTVADTCGIQLVNAAGTLPYRGTFMLTSVGQHLL